MNEMCVMDRTGDSKSIWDPNNADEVAAVKATFDTLKKKGYLAYKVNEKDDRGEVLREFDKSLGKIIMIERVLRPQSESNRV